MAITYSLISGSLPPGVSLTSSGRLSGTISNLTDDETFSFVIRATNTITGIFTDRSFSVVGLNDPLRWITNEGELLPDQNEGNLVDVQLQATNPDNLILVYTLLSGSLPPGLSISPTGRLSGTIGNITSEQNYIFVVRVNDGNNLSDRQFTIRVLSDGLEWITNPGLLSNATENDVLNIQLLTAGGNDQNLSFSIVGGSLPPGISMSTSGNITGTVYPLSDNGISNFTIRVTDGNDILDRSFSINLTDLPPVWNTGINDASFITDEVVNFQFNASNQIGTTTVFSTIDTLPGTLVLSPTGLLTGNTGTSPAIYTTNIVADDGTTQVARSFDILVLGQVSWNEPITNIVDVYEGGTVNYQLNASTENNTTLTYSTLSTLPPGISLSPSGLLSGTAQAVGVDTPYDIVFTVDDTFNSVDITLRITVLNSEVTWVTPVGNIITAYENDTVNYTLSAINNGPEAPTFSVNNGGSELTDLPGTLIVSSSGNITGTLPPTDSDKTYVLEFEASTSYDSATTTLNIVNNNHVITWSTAAGVLLDGYEADTVNIQLAATTSSSDTVSYLLDSGTLPLGVTLSSTGLLSGSFPSLASDTTYDFTITATDGNSSSSRVFSMIGRTHTLSWVTPAGNIVDDLEGSVVNFQLDAPSTATATFTLDSGAFPVGVTMDANGLITGTLPEETVDTTYTFTIEVQDGFNTISRTFDIISQDTSATYTITHTGSPLLENGGLVEHFGYADIATGVSIGSMNLTTDPEGATIYNLSVGFNSGAPFIVFSVVGNLAPSYLDTLTITTSTGKVISMDGTAIDTASSYISLYGATQWYTANITGITAADFTPGNTTFTAEIVTNP